VNGSSLKKGTPDFGSLMDSRIFDGLFMVELRKAPTTLRAVALIACLLAALGCDKGARSRGAPPPPPAEPAPVVLSVEPSAGPLGGGTTVTISGDNFTDQAEVFFGASPAVSVVFVDAQHLQAVTPPGSGPGAVEVRVRTAAGEGALPEAFTYEEEVKPLPEIFSIEPQLGPLAGGNTVRVNGDNFQEDSRLFFGSNEAQSVTFIEVHTLEAVVPPGDRTGPVAVKVETAVGSFTLPAAYTYILPVIESVTPAEGPLAGGTEIVVTGSYLATDGQTTLLVGENPAQIIEAEPETLRATTPPGSAPGPVSVTVTNTYGTATLPGGFTYLGETDAPSLSSVEPTQGSANGGTVITVRGSGFSVSGLKAALCGKELSEVIVLDDNTFQAVVPPGTEGEVCDLTVETQAGSASLPEAFRYLCPCPTVRIAFAPEAVTDAPTLLIEGTAEDPDGVKAVTINGTPAQTNDDFLHFSLQVELLPGDNFFTVGVEDQTGCGNEEALVLHITRLPAPLVDSPLALAVSETGSLVLSDFASGALLSYDPQADSLDVIKKPLPLFDVDFNGEDRLDLCYRSQLWEMAAGGGPLTVLGQAPFALFRSLVRENENSVVALSEIPPALYRFLREAPGLEKTAEILSDATHGSGPKLVRPTGLARLEDGTLLVCDPGAAALFAVNPATGDRTILSGASAGSGDLWVRPTQVVPVGESKAVVLDSGSQNVLFEVDLQTGDRSVLSGPDVGSGPLPAVYQGKGLFPPSDLEFDAATGRLLLADPVTPSLWLVDVQSGDREQLLRASAGSGPKILRPVAIAGNSNALYVITRLPVELFRVDKRTANRSLVAGSTRGTGPLPQQTAGFTVAGQTAYVSDAQAGLILAFDLASGDRAIVAGADTGSGVIISEPGPLAVQGTTLYVFDTALQALLAINTETLERTIVSGAGRGEGTAFPPDIVGAAVTDTEIVLVDRNGTVVGVDRTSGDRRQVAQLDALGGGPTGIAAYSDGLAVVTLGAVFRLSAQDGGLQLLTGPGKGQGPEFVSAQGIVADSQGRLYVMDGHRRAVIQIQPTTGDRVIFSR